jgi:hypothetical protein
MISEIINFLKAEWTIPKRAVHHGELSFFEFACQFNPGRDYSVGNSECPLDLIEFWKESDGARLFLDVTYGQWGLSIYSQKEVNKKSKAEKSRRPEDFISSDLIIGQFIGDLDLLLRLSDGKIAVVTPMDPRSDWHIVAENFEEFLRQYSTHSGEKFWEFHS